MTHPEGKDDRRNWAFVNGAPSLTTRGVNALRKDVGLPPVQFDGESLDEWRDIVRTALQEVVRLCPELAFPENWRMPEVDP